MLETFPLDLFCVLSKLFFLSLSYYYYYYYFYTRLSSPFSPTLSLEYTRRERIIIPRNNNNVRNKKWWDSWKNPRFFEKKFDSIFFSSFFFEPERKVTKDLDRERERKSPERKREGERESVNLTRVCVLRSIVPFFKGRKIFTSHTRISTTTHAHTYIHVSRRRQR